MENDPTAGITLGPSFQCAITVRPRRIALKRAWGSSYPSWFEGRTGISGHLQTMAKCRCYGGVTCFGGGSDNFTRFDQIRQPNDAAIGIW